MACALHHTWAMSEQTELEREARSEAVDESDVRAGVMQALRDLELGERDAMERLHDMLNQFVAVRRSAGRTCQEAAAEVREIIAQPATPQGARKIPPVAREALAELTERWCEEEFART